MALATIFLDRRVLEVIFVASYADAWASLSLSILSLFRHFRIGQDSPPEPVECDFVTPNEELLSQFGYRHTGLLLQNS